MKKLMLSSFAVCAAVVAFADAAWETGRERVSNCIF